jgi:uncharacterized protein (TIGR03503 family)
MRHYLFPLFFLLTFTTSVCAEQAKPVEILPADVRLLIDVSGSMKRTDPNNLRKPALELLVKLLPDGSRAGVWSFGQSVNLLVPHSAVTASWRDTATAKTNGVNSNAMFTNIGAALEAATYDGAKNETGFRNNIILLTDGVVDIEKSPENNARERQRILDELLPQLKKSGYIVHTIALSDEADKELMEKLSLATDGVFATVKDAEQLMNAFLRIFDQAVPLERLPLENNRFLVDAAVEEFTALIFRKADAQPTELIAPDGQKFTAADAPDSIKWHKAGSYDLITVTKPAAGQWQVSAEMDPDNRVTVVSNLQLIAVPLNNNIEVSQPVGLHFSLQEDGATVSDPQFLQLLDIDVTVTRTQDGKQWQIPLVDPVPPIDGVYQHPLEVFRQTGNYAIQLVVDGKTFKREYKHQLTVGSPFTVQMEKHVEENRVTYQLKVSADDQRVDIKRTTIAAEIRSSSGESITRNFIPGEPGTWSLAFSPATAARYSVGLQVDGWRNDGEPVKETLATQYFTYPEKDDPVPAAVDEADIGQPLIAQPLEPSDENASEVEAPAISDEQSAVAPAYKKWLMYGGFFIANLLVFALAFFGYRLVVGKKAKAEIEELEETLNVDVAKIISDKKSAIPPMQEVEDKTTRVIDVADQDPVGEIDFNHTDDATDDFANFLADTNMSTDVDDKTKETKSD